MHRTGSLGDRIWRALAMGALLAPSLWVTTAPPAAAAETPVANPPIAESCGIDVSLVLDASGSVSQSQAVGDVRNAAEAFLQSLRNTNSFARVSQFGTVAAQLAPRTAVDDSSLGAGGALSGAISDYYNPRPPRPNGVNFYQYDGSGSVQSPGNFKLSNQSSSDQYTNWDQSLDLAGSSTDGRPELVVYITDGDPTAYDLNQPGDPFGPPHVAFSTDRGEAAAVTLDRAIVEANQIKGGGTRVMAVGVGSAVTQPASLNRLTQIAGPQIVRDADLDSVDSINDIDVAAVTDFEDLAQFLREVVLELCSPSLTIRKLAQSPLNALYTPAPDWDMTVTPTVPGGFTWILPSPGGSAPSQTAATDANGYAQFQWEPTNAGALSEARIEEGLRPGYLAGRPDEPDWRCELTNADGEVRVMEGELDLSDPASPRFTLPSDANEAIGQEIVTCTVWNSFNYAPAIDLDKVNAPTELRGDLDPAAEVTSTYTVTNPGASPLRNLVLSDDKCAPIVPTTVDGTDDGFNVGDLDQNGWLDRDASGEAWLYTCARGITTEPSNVPEGQTIANIAEVVGSDASGATVTANAADDVVAYNPAVVLSKLVNGEESVTVATGSTVNYTFAVSNSGNTPLSDVRVEDLADPDNACTPVRGPDSPGNDDAVLGLNEIWHYSCDVAVSADTADVATVRATPLNPVSGNAFPDPNPDVTATDRAEVSVIDAQLSLTKQADPRVVFADMDSQVTYTYGATNPETATADLAMPSDAPPGWVTDDKCDDVTQVLNAAGTGNVGDTGPADGRINPGETWQFTCTAVVNRITVNVARIIAQPVDGEGDPVGEPLTRRAIEVVEVVEPHIQLSKSTLTPTVLDPDTDTETETNVQDPARYTYQVTNNGKVPLRTVALSDDHCTDIEGPVGDDGVLDVLSPGEIWTYTCQTILERQDQNVPPQDPGDLSGFVQNTAEVTAESFVPQPGDSELVGPEVTDSDIAQVLVIEPRLEVRKTVDPTVLIVGHEATYTVEVENLGGVGLQIVDLTDDKCPVLRFVGGENAPANGLLDGANSGHPETWTYTCTRAIPMPGTPPFTDQNTVRVRALDYLGNAYADEDSAAVRVLDPAIHLDKRVSEELVPTGTEVTYDFDVTNVGNSPIPRDDALTQLTLADVSEPEQPSCAKPELVGKTGGNDDDFLDRIPAETWTYRCAATITEVTNDEALVEAVGGQALTPPLTVHVFDISHAFVQPFNPGISVTKQASVATLPPGGGDVTYTYTVKNTGDVPLSEVASRISDDTCSTITYVSGDTDQDNLLDTPISIFEDQLDETWLFTCTTRVTQDTTNTVVVVGTPVDPDRNHLCHPPQPAQGALRASALPAVCDVTDRDEAMVSVPQMGSITVTKRTSPASSVPFTFDLAGQSFQLADGQSRASGPLPAATYTVRETPTSGWTLSGLVCADPSGGTTVDPEQAVATIALAEGEHVSCTFTNEQDEVAPPAPVDPADDDHAGDLPDTGAHSGRIAGLLAGGVLLVGLGGLLMAARRAWTRSW